MDWFRKSDRFLMKLSIGGNFHNPGGRQRDAEHSGQTATNPSRWRDGFVRLKVRLAVL